LVLGRVSKRYARDGRSREDAGILEEEPKGDCRGEQSLMRADGLRFNPDGLFRSSFLNTVDVVKNNRGCEERRPTGKPS
jgi:hypothetical protein